MTTEHKQYVELTDIVGVKFECGNCGAYISLPLNHNVVIPEKCPVCQANWLGAFTRNRASERVTEFFAAYHRLTLALAEDAPNPTRFDLKLEVRGSN